MENFFIFDCHGSIVGNPKGYATMRGASRIANMRKTQNLLWDTFDNRQDKSVTLVWEIRESHQDKPAVCA